MNRTPRGFTTEYYSKCYMNVVYEKCLKRTFQTEGSVAHQPLLVSENQIDCPFVWYQSK